MGYFLKVGNIERKGKLAYLPDLFDMEGPRDLEGLNVKGCVSGLIVEMGEVAPSDVLDDKMTEEFFHAL